MTQENKITWEILKDLSDALDSYRVKALIDAKKDILTAGVYSELQYFSLLFKMVEEEKLKYALFNQIKLGKIFRFHHLKNFSENHSIELNRVFSLLKLLQMENLIDIENEYDDVKTEAPDLNATENILNENDIKIRTLNPDFLKVRSIYEPVRVIFDAKICSGCGMCVSVCPVNCLDVLNGFGKFDEEKCIKCGLCFYTCPRSYLPIDALNMALDDASELKHYSQIGSYLQIFSARSKIKEIAEKCQDGGITSTLLFYLFEKGLITHGIGAKMSNTTWRPEPIVLKNKEDVLLTLGTKYVNNPSLKVLKTVMEENNASIAVAGVPCMMQALLKSKVYDINLPALKNIRYRIGIFCMESFSYQNLLKICEKMNVAINEVNKMNINKGKFFAHAKNGQELNIPMKEITHLAREDCETCFDLTSESADISVGSIGSPSGWNTVIVRTKTGMALHEQLIKENLIESKEMKDVEPGLPLLLKVATSKRKKCNEHINLKKADQARYPRY